MTREEADQGGWPGSHTRVLLAAAVAPNAAPAEAAAGRPLFSHPRPWPWASSWRKEAWNGDS